METVELVEILETQDQTLAVMVQVGLLQFLKIQEYKNAEINFCQK